MSNGALWFKCCGFHDGFDASLYHARELFCSLLPPLLCSALLWWTNSFIFLYYYYYTFLLLLSLPLMLQITYPSMHKAQNFTYYILPLQIYIYPPNLFFLRLCSYIYIWIIVILSMYIIVKKAFKYPHEGRKYEF